MLQIIPSSHKDVIVVKAVGLLTDEDYHGFVPRLEAIIKDQGPISLLLEFENFKGWEPGALWADFRLALKHPDDFKKMAIVGEKSWHHLFAVLAKAFCSREVRYFNHGQIHEAWDWILDRNQPGEAGQADKGAVSGDQGSNGITPYSSIAVAMDFSPHAEKALAKAVELADRYGATVAMVHACESIMRYNVLPDDFLDSSLSFPVYDPELDQHLFDSAKKRMEEMAEKTGHDRITVDVVWGSPASTIISYAESRKSDLIVAGSHGRKGIAKLLGSTANSIINSARCDVLVVRIE